MDVSWVKLSVSLADNRKIKQIRTLPEGDSIALLWIFLICLAGEINEGGRIKFSEEIPYTEEMLSNQFRMDVGIIRMGLKTFKQFGMIEYGEDGSFYLVGWEEHQAEDKLAEIREQTRERNKRYRERKRLAAESEASKANVTANATHDVRMTSRDATDKDKEKDIEKEIESARNIRSSNNIQCAHARAREEQAQDDRTQSDQPKAPARKVRWYGNFKNVALTDEEYAALLKQAENRDALIEDLSAYKASTSRTYANDYAALLRTEERRRARQKPYSKKQPVGVPSYDIAGFEAQGFDIPDLGGGENG